MFKLLAITCCHLLSFIKHDSITLVFAFSAPLNLQYKRTSGATLHAKRSKPRRVSKGTGFAKKVSEPKLITPQEKSDLTNEHIFDAHFSDFVCKEDVINLLSVCNEVNNLPIHQQLELENVCRTEEGTQTVIATKNISRGQILTLLPIHALGLRNVRESKDGIEYIQFVSKQYENLYRENSFAGKKLNIPLNPDEVVYPITGRKPFIRLFVLSLPENEAGWVGDVKDSASSAGGDGNCVTLPIPFAAPFCAVVATKDIQKGDTIIQRTQPLERSEIEELNNILEEEQIPVISMLRQKIQKVFLGPFHSINLQYPGLKQVHNSPDIYEVDNFLTGEECDKIINEARSHLKPVTVYDEESGQYEPSQRRTHSITQFPRTDSSQVIHKLSKLACCNAESIDGASVLNYKEGQEVKPHTDHASIDELKQFRVGVVFCYLNDVSKGGTTFFSEIDLNLKPRKGTAVIHFPSDLKGRLDDRTMHQGSPAVDEKWLLVVTWSNVEQAKPYTA